MTSTTLKELGNVGKAGSIAEESLMGVRTVQAFNGQEEMTERLRFLLTSDDRRFFLDIPPNSIRARCTLSGKAFGAVSSEASFTSFCLLSSDAVFCKTNDGLQNMLLF